MSMCKNRRMDKRYVRSAEANIGDTEREERRRTGTQVHGILLLVKLIFILLF